MAIEGEEYWPSCKLGQFEPERATVGASQHEHEPAAKTYSGIFSPYRERRPLAVRPVSRSVDMVKNAANIK